MNSEATPASAAMMPAARREWLPAAMAGALALLTCIWLCLHLAPATMSPDSNGYVVQARLLATTGTTHFKPESPAQFVGIHWLETTPGVFHSRYPAGLPIIFAAAWKLGGFRAALLVNPLLAGATVWLIFLLARRLADNRSALLAAAVYAANATVQQHALDADAHVATAFLLTAGVLALLRFAENPAVPHGLVAGGLLGLVPTIRYPEAIVGLTVAAWLLWRIRPVARLWPAVLGAALPIGALMAHNTAAYGAFWRTGYALTNEQTGFGWSYFSAHWLGYLQSLGGAGLGLFFAFGIAGLAGLVADARHRPTGMLLAGIITPLILLYMAYYFGGGDGSLRFLVPTFPLLSVAGAWMLSRATTAIGVGGNAIWITVAALQLIPGSVGAGQRAARMETTLRAAAQARRTLEQRIPTGSVVVVERQLGESLDATGQWRLVEENLLARPGEPGAFGGMMGPGGRGGAGPARGGRGGLARANLAPDEPNPQQADKNRAQRERYDGLRPMERQARVWEDILAWSGGKPAYWYARSMDAVENALPEGADYESIAEIDAPVVAGPGGGGRGGPLPGAPGRGDPGLAPTGRGRGGNFPPGRGGFGAIQGNAVPQKLRLVKITFAATGGASPAAPGRPPQFNNAR